MRNKFYIDVKKVKKILELEEKEFIKYGQINQDFWELESQDEFNLYEFKRACDFVLGRKIGLPCAFKKSYRQFAEKYRFLLEHIGYGTLDNYNYCGKKGFYDYLCENYDNKEQFLSIFDKLLELGIHYFDFIPNKVIDDSFQIVISKENIKAVSTDGKISFKACNPSYYITYYPVTIEDANFIIKYQKDKTYHSGMPRMIANNLLFDIEALPSYQELYDINVLPYIDYQEANRQRQLVQEKNKLIYEVNYVEDTAEAAENFLSRLEHLTQNLEHTKDLKEAKAIIEKIEVIKELHSDIETVRNSIVESADKKGLMSEEELSKSLQKNNHR